jgi:methyl-accepting chemotaxis protein
MTMDERLGALLTIAQENSQGIKDLLNTTREHSKQLETDGQHIKQLAMMMQDLQSKTETTSEQVRLTNIDVQRMSNAVEALMETIAHHETRIDNIEQA